MFKPSKPSPELTSPTHLWRTPTLLPCDRRIYLTSASKKASKDPMPHRQSRRKPRTTVEKHRQSSARGILHRPERPSHRAVKDTPKPGDRAFKDTAKSRLIQAHIRLSPVTRIRPRPGYWRRHIRPAAPSKNSCNVGKKRARLTFHTDDGSWINIFGPRSINCYQPYSAARRHVHQSLQWRVHARPSWLYIWCRDGDNHRV